VKRFVAAGGALAAAMGGILWFLLLMSTAADTMHFFAQLPAADRPQHRPGAGHGRPGRLAVAFAVARLPCPDLRRPPQTAPDADVRRHRCAAGRLVYGVSVQFVTRSIESWFDVRVEKALESGLHLGRSALDSLLADLVEKGRGMAVELSDIRSPRAARPVALARAARACSRRRCSRWAGNCCPAPRRDQQPPARPAQQAQLKQARTRGR
jgi:hypothetical protein